MHFNARNSAVYVVLCTAALVTWLASRPDAADQRPAGPPADAPPGYYLEDVTLLGTDDAGAVMFRIVAGRVEESGSERELELSDVRVQYRDSEAVAWLVEAERATAPSDRSWLNLRGNIRVTSAAEEPSRQVVIEADRLLLEPERYTATTDSPVILSFDGNRLEANGLSADLKDDRLELSSVHGRFDPRERSE